MSLKITDCRFSKVVLRKYNCFLIFFLSYIGRDGKIKHELKYLSEVGIFEQSFKEIWIW